MTSEERRAWLYSLKPGDKVQVLSSYSTKAEFATVVENEPGSRAWDVAVDDGRQHPGGHRAYFSRTGGGRSWPFGSPAYIGDIDRIFPADADTQEIIDRLRLMYAFNPNEMNRRDPYFDSDITTVRKLLAVLSEAEEGKEKE